MNKAELESKHLSELHALAAEAGVESYRMLPRAELIDKLADGGGGGSRSGGGGGGGRARESRGGQRQSRGGRGRQSRGGRDRQAGEGGERQSRGGRGRQPRVGDERRSGGGGGRQDGGRDAGDRERPESPQGQPAPGGEGGAAKPRRRRRRRFRKGGKSVRAGELILAAPGGQSIVYGESRQSCTALLRELASELAGGRGPDPIALLIDPGPEELADWKREAPKAEIVSAGQDRHAADALAQAARRAEAGEAVVLLIDSVSRLAESFGSNVAKDLLADGRAAGGSGTLTVVAAVERAGA
jgi:Rho termination factor, N-terminal domain